MDFNVNVIFDVTDKLGACLYMLSNALRGKTKAEVGAELEEEAELPAADEKGKPTAVEHMKAENPAFAKMVDKLELEEVKEEPKAEEPVPATLTQGEITEADIRDAMQRVRDRIETQEDKAEREKVHRMVTNRLKITAEEVAGCKPSQKPTQEGRKTFIDRIESLELIDGEVTFKPPF